ncbi:MAG: hypothetical protein HUK15_00110, partial [Bacteroidales bacterium]|nr:hypothetical protein [Bacteroidales bacterium]
MKNIRIIIALVLLSFGMESVWAQDNSWINYDQSYYKIQVIKDGVYRIYNSDFVAANVPINVVNANKIQIFHNGEEQYIHISGINPDGTLSANGYIEFYGQRNRGNLELDFYSSPEHQINPDVSLYNDSAAYFITWNYSGTGRRMTVTNDSDFDSHIANRQNFCIRQQRANYTGKYYLGNTRSYFTSSEGWLDATTVTPSGVTKNISTANCYTAGPDTEVEFAIGGINAVNSPDFAEGHHLTVSCR